MTVPATRTARRSRACRIDPVEAQPRQVFFFDTPDLAPEPGRRRRAGAAHPGRARRHGRQAAAGRARRSCPRSCGSSPAFNVEVDVAARAASSARRRSRAGARARRSATRSHGEVPLRKLFSKDQRAFYADARARRASSSTRSSCSVRPSSSRPCSGATGRASGAAPLVAEMWLYPDGSRILELSTKCLPGRGVPGRGREPGPTSPRAGSVEIGGQQQTKTKTALEFFHAELKAQVAEAGESGPRSACARGTVQGPGGQATSATSEAGPKAGFRGQIARAETRIRTGDLLPTRPRRSSSPGSCPGSRRRWRRSGRGRARRRSRSTASPIRRRRCQGTRGCVYMVMKGRKMSPSSGQMNVPNTASTTVGRAIQ